MNLLKTIRSFICFNQKELIQYEYEVAEDHKNLRLHIENIKNININENQKLINALVGTAYDGLTDILNENVELIRDMFASIHKNAGKPRITIKTIEENFVLDFFRSDMTVDLRESYIEENTGFSKIMNDNKDYFLCDDLEADFLNGDYINPRLDDTKKEDLRAGNISWEDCWKKISDSDLDKHPYRSTLIIPMAIRIGDLDKPRFVQHFSDNVEQNRDSRTIWGFLCFDYPEKNIFSNLEDDFKDSGYIVADILSLYLMFFYNHLSGSKTFNEAMELTHFSQITGSETKP